MNTDQVQAKELNNALKSKQFIYKKRDRQWKKDVKRF